METRRVRRLEQRHVRHVVAVVASIGALGLGVGMTMPRNTIVAAVVLAAAAVSLTIMWARAEHRAPSRGLTRVVRLPTKMAVGAALDASRSRITGTARATWARVWPARHEAVDAVDEADEEPDEEFWHFDVRADLNAR